MDARDDGVSQFGAGLVHGLTEAVALARGKKARARASVVEVLDMRAIQSGLHMSQHEFAGAFRIPPATIKNWEQSRCVPDAPTAAYLHAIARCPKVLREALQSDQTGSIRMESGCGTRWLVLGSDGRHVTIGRHRDPSDDDIAQSEAALKAQGLAGWLVLMKGGYYDIKQKPELMMIRPLGELGSDWEHAVAAFEVIRQKAVHSS